MTTVELIFQAIQGLPVPDRLRLVERVVHELVETPREAPVDAEPAPSPIGLFADDPEGVDDVMRVVAENRRRWRLLGGQEEAGGRSRP